MKALTAFLSSRVAIVVLTSLATAVGTALATEYPSIYSAVCS